MRVPGRSFSVVVRLAALGLSSLAAGGCALAQQKDAGALLSAYLARAQGAERTAPIGGNRAEILIDGPETHRAMFEAIGKARDHVNLETYILEAGEIGEALAQLVERKVREGVGVNILYDSVGSLSTPQAYFERLRGAGAAICEFNPVNPAQARGDWKINNRDHRKILVVDGKVAFTGGINLSSTYSAGSRSNRPLEDVKPGEKSRRGWRDTQVRVEGPIVARFQRLFLDAWAQQRCNPLGQARYYPALARRGDLAMQVLAGEPGVDASEMYATLLTAIGRAKERVWLAYGYFVPDPMTVHALVLAAGRGVDVRLVLPGFSDFWAPVQAGRSHYEELLAAGVRIFEWREAIMHAKTALIDDSWSSIGSTNLDWRSFVHNYEADLVVHDRGFARAMERRFRADMKAAVEITAEAWDDRGVLQRVQEWFARQWEYLL